MSNSNILKFQFLDSEAGDVIKLKKSKNITITVDPIFTDWYQKLLRLKPNEDPDRLFANCKEAFKGKRNYDELITDLSDIYPNIRELIGIWSML